MAQPQTHLTCSVVVGIAYVLLGSFLANFRGEVLLLASVIVVISGMLPNADDGGGPAGKELGGLVAAVAPLLVLAKFPGIVNGGMVRVALVILLGYVCTRFIVVTFLQKFTVHRGAFHSVPAAIIAFEAVFLLFPDVGMKSRVYLASAALVGFLSHLVIDGYRNVDLVGKAMGKEKKKEPVIKFFGKSLGANIVLYSVAVVLGWHVIGDLVPFVRRYI